MQAPNDASASVNLRSRHPALAGALVDDPPAEELGRSGYVGSLVTYVEPGVVETGTKPRSSRSPWRVRSDLPALLRREAFPKPEQTLRLSPSSLTQSIMQPPAWLLPVLTFGFVVVVPFVCALFLGKWGGAALFIVLCVAGVTVLYYKSIPTLEALLIIGTMGALLWVPAGAIGLWAGSALQRKLLNG
jgi:hypothetical protein